jgi:hypothetical protein
MSEAFCGNRLGDGVIEFSIINTISRTRPVGREQIGIRIATKIYNNVKLDTKQACIDKIEKLDCSDVLVKDIIRLINDV